MENGKVLGPEALAEWYSIKQKLDEYKTKEMAMRKAIFAQWFPDAVEGVNRFELPDNYLLKGSRIINRSVETASLQAMADKFKEAGINTDVLVQYKPELKISAYRDLSDEQRHLFDQCLIIKDGSPVLEIAQNKRAAPGWNNAK